MTLARRLIASGRGGASFTPPPTTWSLTTADDGGSTHAGAPKYLERAGYLYFGYVDMATGNIEVRSMLLSAPYTVSSAFVLHTSPTPDMHDVPALYVRPDGRMLAAYCRHDDTTMRVRVTTNVLPDISAWGSEASLDASLGGGDYTYPILLEYASDLWLFYRDWQGGDTAVLCYSVSTDDGATWSAQTEVYRSTDRASYWMIDSDGSRIDVVASDGRNPPDADPVTIGHVYYDGTWRHSDGTSAGSLPLDPSDLTEVYDAGDGMGWPMDIVAGSHPVFTYAVLDDPASNSWRRARWTGSAWINRVIAESDGVIDSPFASAVILDHNDPDRAYAPVYDGSHWGMHRFVTEDAGATWADIVIAGGSTDHILPGPVYGSTGLVRTVWMTGGPYTGYLDGGFGLTAGR